MIDGIRSANRYHGKAHRKLPHMDRTITSGAGKPTETAFFCLFSASPCRPTNGVHGPFVTLKHEGTYPAMIAELLPYPNGVIFRGRRKVPSFGFPSQRPHR